MNSPIKWVGGKSQSCKKICDLIPEHDCYCELFFGAGHIFFNKEVSKVEVINDINNELMNFYRVIQRSGSLFLERGKFELYSKELYEEYKRDFEGGKHAEMNDIERAFRFYCMLRESFSGRFGSGWGYSGTRNEADVFFRALEGIEQVTKRLRNVQIDCRDFEAVIDGFDGDKTVFICCLPETKIRTTYEELINIENIKEGDTVFSGGEVLNVMERDYIGDIYKLGVMGLKDTVNVTEEHPMGIVTNVLGFIKAKDLKVGDRVLIPLGAETVLYDKNLEDRVVYDYYNINTALDISVPCNYETGWILGLWLADGTISSDYSIRYTFGVEKVVEKKYHEKICQWFMNNFNKELTINEYQREVKKRDPYWDVNCNDKGIVAWFSKLFGEDKIIPYKFMIYNLDFQKGLLRGWLDGDGHIANPDGKGGNIQIDATSRNLDLINKMYLISLRLDLTPSLRKKIDKRDGKIDYRLTISNIKDASFLYPELYGDRKSKSFNPGRQTVIIDNKKYIAVPIQKIECEHYEGKVYNITTENDVYVANYTLCHNCDPPYIGSDNSNYEFEGNKFTLYDHQRLYLKLKNIKGKFILTIDDCEFIRERYCNGEFNVIENEVFYSGSDTDSRKHVKELIIMNYNSFEMKRHVDYGQGKLNF